MRTPALVLLISLVGVSRADEPPPTAVKCNETGCGGVTYEELMRRAATDDGSNAVTAWPQRWAPVEDITMFKAAAKQPVEGPSWEASRGWRAELDRISLDGSWQREDVERDSAASARRDGSGEEGASEGSKGRLPGAEAQAATSPPLAPDDLEFLDVVLVGSAAGYHCTGVLVAPDAVLTAAHCAPAATVGFGLRATRLRARVAVTGVTLHPQLDVALLRLGRVMPVPIRPRRRAADTSAPFVTVRLVGFGVDDVRHPTSFGVKRRADVLAAGWGCDRGRARSARCRPGAELLLTAVGGADTCRGDSGGPVLEPTDSGLRLLAITSRSTASGGATCGRGGIYVRADAIDAWLTKLLEKRP